MMQKFRQISYIFLLLGILMVPYLVFAQDIMGRLQKTGHESGFETSTEQTGLPALVGSIINVFFSLLGILFLVQIVLAGYHWMMAGGNDTKVKDSQTAIRNATIGLIITVSSYAIWAFIAHFIIGD